MPGAEGQLRAASGLRLQRVSTYVASPSMAAGDPMTKNEVDKLLKLPAEERLEIAQVLWNSVDPEDEARFLCLPDWQRRILQDRLADLERNPDDEQPWDQVKEELWPRG